MFNNYTVQSVFSHKQLELILDAELGVNDYINNKINKCNKIIGPMRKLSLLPSRKALLKSINLSSGRI